LKDVYCKQNLNIVVAPFSFRQPTGQLYRDDANVVDKKPFWTRCILTKHFWSRSHVASCPSVILVQKPRGFLSKSAFGQKAMLTFDQVFLVMMHFAQPFWSRSHAYLRILVFSYVTRSVASMFIKSYFIN
jgi:hypothetical protein